MLRNNSCYFDQCTDSPAAFGQHTWNVTEQLALLGVMRYSDEQKAVYSSLSYSSDFMELVLRSGPL